MEQKKESPSNIMLATTERKTVDGYGSEKSQETAAILVVDDEKGISDSLSDYFKTLGYNSESVYSGADALTRLEQKHFDLIVTDFKMPGMNGMELIEEIRNRKKETRVILMTGYATIELGAEAMAKGALDCISKPFRFDEIETIVSRALTKKLSF
jgi:DNA-binding NtrC family response regulator